jgi:hypothetical protein
LVGKPDRITSQQSALQFKDLAWKENRSRSPLTRITSTLFSVTTALFGVSPSSPMVLPGNSCRASRNHPANLRVPDSNDVLLQNSFRSPPLLLNMDRQLRPMEANRSPWSTLIGAGYRDLAGASGKPSATEAYCFCDQQGGNNGGNLWIADLSG